MYCHTLNTNLLLSLSDTCTSAHTHMHMYVLTQIHTCAHERTHAHPPHWCCAGQSCLLLRRVRKRRRAEEVCAAPVP